MDLPWACMEFPEGVGITEVISKLEDRVLIMLAALAMKVTYPGIYFELLQRDRKPVQTTFNRTAVEVRIYHCQQSFLRANIVVDYLQSAVTTPS